MNRTTSWQTTRTQSSMLKRLAFLVSILILCGCAAVNAHGQGISVSIQIMPMCGEQFGAISMDFELRVDGNRIPFSDLSSRYVNLSPGTHRFTLSVPGQSVVQIRDVYLSRLLSGQSKLILASGGAGFVDVPITNDLSRQTLTIRVESCGGSPTPTAKPQPNDIIATLQQLKGDVSVRSNGGSFRDASVGQQLRAGDDLATGPESEATITFSDGSTVYVRPFTQISVGALEKRRNSLLVRLNLEMGRIAAKVSKSETAAPDYSVKTPAATASVRGTYFTVGHDQQSQTTTVLVEEGEVQVTPDNSSLQSFTLRAGQQARVTKNNVSPVTPVIANGGGVVGGSGTGNGELVPLKLYWNAARGDNFTTATTEGQQAAEAAGYTFVRIEGYVFRTQRSGTVPLKLYWSAAREDNFTTATSQGEREAQSAGYIYVRVEGYVYPTQQSGTAPLKNYWSAARGDNFTTATGAGEQDAKGGGYVFAWVEGYVLPKP